MFVLAVFVLAGVVLATGPARAMAAEQVGTTGPSLTSSEETTPPPGPAATRLAVKLPSTCDARATITAIATLTDEKGMPVAGKTVTILQLKPTTATLGRGTTDASGRFSAKLSPRTATAVQAVFAGDARHVASKSAIRTVKPRVLLGRPWTHTTIAYPGQRLPARGKLWPKHGSASTATSIRCERYENGKWVYKVRYKAKTITTSSGSKYSAVIKLPKTGTWRVAAEHSDSGHAKTIGPYTKIKVKDWRKRYVGYKNRGFKTDKKMVAITIDDGPGRRTLAFARVLESYGGKGTVFFTRQLIWRNHKDTLRKVYNRGHEVANHTVSHKMLIGSYSRSYYQAYKPMATIRSATGFDPIWIRAMGGGVDSTGMKAVVATGQLYCNWSIDSYDSHRRYTAPSVLYRNVIRGVRPGAVILIHETHPETLEALPRICKELNRRGYKMVTLSELAAQSRRR